MYFFPLEISNLAEQPADIDIQNFGQRLELDVRYRAFLWNVLRSRAPAILRLPGASFRVFILITNFFACFSIRNFVVAKFGSSKYDEI